MRSVEKILLVALLLITTKSNLEARQWRYLGLRTESITTIAVDWSDSNTLYAGSSSNFSEGTVGGIFKSTNAGATWDTLIRGVTARTIAIHPTNPRIIYATLGINFLTPAGIIKSADGGAHWTKADYGIRIDPEVGPGPFAIDPKHPDTVYTGTAGPFGGGFYKSTNGGSSWSPLGDTTALRNGVTTIAVDYQNTDVVYVGTAWTGDLLRSSDGGTNWALLGFRTGLPYTIEFGENSSTVYVGSTWSDYRPVGIYKTTDGGVTWSNIPKGLPDSANVHAIQILKSTTGPQVFVAANWRDSGGIYQSIGGNDWKWIGISSGRVETIKLEGTKLYAGYRGIYQMDVETSAVVPPPEIPLTFFLYQSFPNPFNPRTEITYEIGKQSNVLLEIFQIQGRKIITLIRKEQPPGRYSVYWDGRDENGIRVTSGVYYYVLRAEAQVAAKKMIYVK